MKKKTDLFDRLDNVFGNYMEGKATEKDVIDTACKVNKYLLENPHPHDVIKNNVGLSNVVGQSEQIKIMNAEEYFKEHYKHPEIQMVAKESAIHFAEAYLRHKTESQKSAIPCVISWMAFDHMNLDTRPKDYGKYLIVRKDGKTHWETWNGSGWAYNHNEIRYWADIKQPCL